MSKIEKAVEEAFKERVEGFLKEYEALGEKYKVNFVFIPEYQPDGTGGFKTIISKMPVDLNLQQLNESFLAKK